MIILGFNHLILFSMVSFRIIKNCVSDILNSLIWPTTLRNGIDSINDFSVFPAPLGEPVNTNSIETASSVSSSSSTSLLNRTSLMITLSDIHKIVTISYFFEPNIVSSYCANAF